VAWQLLIYSLAIGMAGLAQVVGSSFKAAGPCSEAISHKSSAAQ
jgi:hypothetical protein